MNDNKQQTAVEWLWEIAYNRELTVEDWKQAKEMEKAQQGNTWGNALSAITVDKWESFEQFYNETYGGNK